jgi:hypothetical protein
MALVAKQQQIVGKAAGVRRSAARVVVCKASKANGEAEMVRAINGVAGRQEAGSRLRSTGRATSARPLPAAGLVPADAPSPVRPSAPPQPRRAALGMLAGVAALASGAAPSLAAYGDSANVFGKVTNTSGGFARRDRGFGSLGPRGSGDRR